MYKHFDYLLFRKICDVVELLVFPRVCNSKDIIMQCDSDIQSRHQLENEYYKGCKTYEIADTIWHNRQSIRSIDAKRLTLRYVQKCNTTC